MASLSSSEEEEEEEEESEYEEQSEEEETDLDEFSSRSGSSDDADDDDDDDENDDGGMKGKATDEDLCNKVIDLLERGKKLHSLKLTEFKAYLRKHELRISGTKAICIERILEHWRIKDGNGEKLYPKSSFSINCTGDVCKGDVILFKQRVYEKFDKVKRGGGGNIIGTRTIAGKVVKESYGATKQQHTFTVEILWCKGTKAWPPLYPLLVKGRNLYRLKTFRQPWNNETERSKVLAEKHKRGATARHVRAIAKSSSQNRASKKYSSSRVPPYMRRNKERDSSKNKIRTTRDITPSARRRSNTSKQVAEKRDSGPSITHPKESSSERVTETRHPRPSLTEVRYQQSTSNRVAESRYLGSSVAEPRYSGSSLAETIYPRSLIAHSERSNSNRVVETRYPGLPHAEARYQSSSIAHPEHSSVRGQYGLYHGVPYHIYNQAGQERIGMPAAYQPRREMLHQPNYIMEYTSSAGRVPHHHAMNRSESYIGNPYAHTREASDDGSGRLFRGWRGP
ncbi:zinc finger CCCH domain-containing protein 62-like isoform X1 [Iris pallida]|uniref:Zinc finger CCCH domain-containing protein 62-like isoform X1 n=1 Tax=Iris pallida TaxID=29817 RepID=A0AAX6IGJ1_IRIPA|nr:zinc finger CCCH domain-containing protein 62-like isoform X1 [Iris pallida]